MMSLLFAYVLLTLLAVLWIARDTKTVDIFDVFGKGFHYVWFESGQRWRYVFTYGWRLAALCSLVLLNGFLSYQFYRANPFTLRPTVQPILFAILLAASTAPLPWIKIANRLRRNQYIRRTALRLSDFAERIIDDSDLVLTLQRADYDTDETWTAWHPTEGEWKSERSSQVWSGLVPVVYVHNDSPRSALFPIDWETFLAWKLPVGCVQINSELPFHGPLGASFRVRSVREIRGSPHWRVINTELQCELGGHCGVHGQSAVDAGRPEAYSDGNAPSNR